MEYKTSRAGSNIAEPAVLNPPAETQIKELPIDLAVPRERWGSVYLETPKGRGDLAVYQAFSGLLGGEHANAFIESVTGKAEGNGGRLNREDVLVAVTSSWEMIESLYRTHLEHLKADIWRKPAPFVHKRLAWELLTTCDATAFGVRRIHRRTGPQSLKLFSDALGENFLEISDEGESIALSAAGDHDFVREAVDRATSIPDLNWRIDS